MDFLKNLSWKGIAILLVGTSLLVVLISTNWFGDLVTLIFGGSLWDGAPTSSGGVAISYLINGCKWVNFLYGFNLIEYLLLWVFTTIRISFGFAYMKFLLWFAEKMS